MANPKGKRAEIDEAEAAHQAELKALEAQRAERIAAMNVQHAVLIESGKTIVITEREDPVLHRLVIDRSDFADIKKAYCDRSVTVTVNGRKVVKPLGDYWLSHPGRRKYTQLVFDPQVQHPEHVYNLWKGFAVEAKPGSWSALRDHLFEIVAGGNDAIANYVLGWLARAVQLPGAPGEVAIVMQGAQGTGKGMFVRAVGHLFGQHFAHVARAHHLTGHFNAHLQDAVLVFADEATWGGDRQNEGALKALITEPTLPIERKGRDAYMVRNVIHLMMASNSEWHTPAGMDDRRFCMVKVRPDRRDDHAYFNAITTQLEQHGGYEAMLFDLQAFDLSTFDHRKPPKTPELLEQKIKNFSPLTRWWFEKLQDGEVLRTQDRWIDPVFCEALHLDYLATMDKAGVKANRSLQVEMGRALMKLLPEGWPQRRRLTIGAIRNWTYTFPDLRVCRAWFAEQLLRQAVEWPALPAEQSDLIGEEAA